MTGLKIKRYGLEWAAILAVTVAPVYLLPTSILASGVRQPIILGILIAGVAEFVVYLAVGQAMLAQPSRVIGRWILSIFGKLCFFGMASAVVAVADGRSLPPFLLALGVSFLFFSCHQVIRLVRVSDCLDLARKNGATS